MTRKRKAELQRTLSMTELPAPPPGLAQRIKDEIPRELPSNVENERERLSRPRTVDFRIAASILLLLSGSLAALNFFWRSQTAPAGASRAKNPATTMAASRPAPIAPINTPINAPAAADRRHERILPTARPPAPNPLHRATKEEGAPALIGGIETRLPEPRTAKNAVARAESPAPATDSPTSPGLAPAEKPALTAEMSKASPDGVNDARDAVAAPIREGSRSAAMPIAVSAQTDSLAPPAHKTRASGVLSGSRTESFVRAERLVRHGGPLDRAAATALMQYFTPPIHRAGEDLALEVEAISAPAIESDTVFLRVSVDAPASGLPPSSDLRLSIEMAAGVVRRSSTMSAGQTEPALPAGASWTLVERLQLRPGLASEEPMAIVRLRYRDARGIEQSVERRIPVSALRPWATASIRGRAAALTTALISRLREGESTETLGRAARDAGLRELAELIDSASRR